MTQTSLRGRAVLMASVGPVALWLGASWLLASLVVRPPSYRPPPSDGRLPDVENATWHGIDSNPRAEFGIPYSDVSIPGPDGRTLRGWFVPGRGEARAALVLVHGAGGDRRDYLRHLPIFTKAGWPVLLIDCLEQGASDGAGLGVSFGAREQLDVIAATRWLSESKSFSRIVAMGTSQGGASVILAAARDPSIDAVIAENPFARITDLLWTAAEQIPAPLRWSTARFVQLRLFGLGPQPLDVVQQIAPRPLLILHGTADEIIDPDQSRLLFERAGEPRSLWIAEDATHTQIFDTHPAEYERRVITFLESVRSQTGPETSDSAE